MVYVLTATYGDGAYDVVTLGVYARREEADLASARVLYGSIDILEVPLNGAPGDGLDVSVWSGPLTQSGKMVG